MKAFAGKTQYYQEGMELRDYFAAKAMQGFIGKLLIIGYDEAVIAKDAYKMADAMMKARDGVENSHEVIAEALAKLNKAAEDNGEKL
jgi:hypothetical protein